MLFVNTRAFSGARTLNSVKADGANFVPHPHGLNAAPHLTIKAIFVTNEPNLMTSDCERHYQSATIQPHGLLLVFSGQDLELQHWSANADPQRMMRGLKLEEILGLAAAHSVRNALSKMSSTSGPGMVPNLAVDCAAEPRDIFIHRHDGFIFLELQDNSASGNHGEQALDLVTSFVQRVGMDASAEQIVTAATRIVSALLGYDRVLVYRFLESNEARVIAEVKRPGMESLLGHLYPTASLLPDQEAVRPGCTARYTMDMEGSPVPLLPHASDGRGTLGSTKPLDISFVTLRALPDEFRQILRQNQVGACLSLEIRSEGRLWGVLACHHRTVKPVSAPVLIGTDLFSRYLSLMVESADRRTAKALKQRAQDCMDRLTAELRQASPTDSETLPVDDKLADLASLIDCDGIAYFVEGRWLTHGVTPDARGLDTILSLSETSDDISDRSSLGDLDIRLGRSDLGGAMVLPFGLETRQALVFLRLDDAHHADLRKDGKAGQRAASLRPPGHARPFTDFERSIARIIRQAMRDLLAERAQQLRDRRARHDRRRRIIQDELNHRIKNIITLIISIARQTGLHSETVEEYSRSLEGRLQALSTAHDQSISGGAARSLLAIVEAEAALYRHQRSPGRLSVDGPVIALDDRASGVIALVMHEMMTNAAKYGALSSPEGRLAVAWHLSEDGSCVIDWRESGGPVVAEPSRKGFGSKLIATSMDYDLGGEAEITFPAEGLRARFIIPASFVVAEMARIPDIAEAEAPDIDLRSLSILVVEDQALIAMELEESLVAMGARVVLASNVSDALACIDRSVPDISVLDVNLGSETSEAIADHLTDIGAPFIFATGYGDRLIIPQRFQDVVVIGKPFEIQELGQAIQNLRNR